MVLFLNKSLFRNWNNEEWHHGFLWALMLRSTLYQFCITCTGYHFISEINVRCWIYGVDYDLKSQHGQELGYLKSHFSLSLTKNLSINATHFWCSALCFFLKSSTVNAFLVVASVYGIPCPWRLPWSPYWCSGICLKLFIWPGFSVDSPLTYWAQI